jgi:hypothetical protein
MFFEAQKLAGSRDVAHFSFRLMPVNQPLNEKNTQKKCRSCHTGVTRSARDIAH